MRLCIGSKCVENVFYIHILKNSILLRNKKAESQPPLKVINSLLLLAICLSAVKLVYFQNVLISVHRRSNWLLTCIFCAQYGRCHIPICRLCRFISSCF